VVERRLHVRPQITAVAARADMEVRCYRLACDRACMGAAACVRECSCMRPWGARCCCVRGCCALRATVVCARPSVRSNAQSAVERTLAASSLYVLSCPC
jgi:hypothetical protein